MSNNNRLISWTCCDFVDHHHRYKWTARICGYWQRWKWRGHIADGFGNIWPDRCECGGKLHVVRPGKVQCNTCE